MKIEFVKKYFQTYMHESRVTSVSMQGNLIASGSDDTLAQVWNMQTQTKLWQFEHEDEVYCLLFHENLLISCSQDKSTRVWNLANGKQIHRLDQSSRCKNFDISPDKSLLAIASSDDLVLFDFSRTTKIEEFKLGYSLNDVKFNRSGTRLLAGSHKGQVFKIDMFFDSEDDDEYDRYIEYDRSISEKKSSPSKDSERLKIFRKLFKKTSKEN